MVNREEAKKEVVIYNTETYPYNIRDNVDGVIDKIFNDFESRVCENCKYIEERSLKSYYGACTINKFMAPSKDFGCNEWEKKC